MDFTNINDPAGVKALLDQLRTSQAWQELQVNSETNPHEAAGQSEAVGQLSRGISDPPLCSPSELENEPEQTSSLVSGHISSLLSRLQSVGTLPPPTNTRSGANVNYAFDENQGSSRRSTLSAHESDLRIDVPVPTHHPLVQTKPPRDLTYNQALPVIARLANNPEFLGKLEKMREDQKRLERRLWGSRAQILQSQEERVKVAQAKAAIVGLGLSRDEASALETSFLEELKAFDSEQALPAWDALIARQQKALEEVDVPGMFVTNLKTDRERQQRIIQVLDGLSGPEDEDMES